VSLSLPVHERVQQRCQSVESPKQAFFRMQQSSHTITCHLQCSASAQNKNKASCIKRSERIASHLLNDTSRISCAASPASLRTEARALRARAANTLYRITIPDSALACTIKAIRLHALSPASHSRALEQPWHQHQRSTKFERQKKI
jgi:hypothetical protein